jgi:Bcr/CflA subfamily drug resistance transporter
VLLIYPLPQMAIDMYLPSWPSMVHALHSNRFLLQFSLTIYILFLGIAQLIYGPLSDRFGRRPMLLIGISIFFLSSVACMFVDSVYPLLVLRAIQGLGMGCGFAIASAILADVFKGHQLAKMASYSAMVYSTALIFAPAIGGYVQHYLGWQANFAIMAVYALILLVFIYFFIFETRAIKHTGTVSPRSILRKYTALFSNPAFIGCVLCLILAYGAMITFNVVGPFLLQESFHVPVVVYGKLLFLVGLSYFLGATINSRLVSHTTIHVLIILGLGLMSVSGIGLLLTSVMAYLDLSRVIVFVCLAMLSLGLIYPNCFAYALDLSPDKGYAGAFIGSAILIGASIISVIVSHANSNHERCLSLAFIILSILSILSYLLTRLYRPTAQKNTPATCTI